MSDNCGPYYHGRPWFEGSSGSLLPHPLTSLLPSFPSMCTVGWWVRKGYLFVLDLFRRRHNYVCSHPPQLSLGQGGRQGGSRTGPSPQPPEMKHQVSRLHELRRFRPHSVRLVLPLVVVVLPLVSPPPEVWTTISHRSEPHPSLPGGGWEWDDSFPGVDHTFDGH